MKEQIIIEKTEVEALYSLRQLVLRPNKPIEFSFFEGDDEITTHHFAAKLQREVVGCATICQRHFPLKKETHRPGFRIRGMAVSPLYQGQGIGGLLLKACLNEARQLDYCWCNARIKAVNLYLSQGFVIVGDEFVIEDIGPHFLMIKENGL